MSKTAIILAGGKGTSIAPFHVSLPKPLVPVGDVPVIEIIISQLARQGFDDIRMAVSYQADVLRAIIGDGSRWGVRVSYAVESTPLGTMGPLRAVGELPEQVLVMNGDTLTDLDYSALFEQHAETDSLFTIASCRRSAKQDFGVLTVDDASGKLTAFQEKPVHQLTVSMGIYVVSRTARELIPHSGPFGFDELMNHMLQQKLPVQVREHTGIWYDLGRDEDYREANERFSNAIREWL